MRVKLIAACLAAGFALPAVADDLSAVLAELYYRYKLNDAIELTPNFQWLRNAGGDATAATVKLAGMRAKLGF